MRCRSCWPKVTAQSSPSTLSEPWSANGAKLPKHFLGGFRRWESYIFCHIYCCWASFLISANFPKYPESALERQTSKNGETNLLVFSLLDIMYVLPNLLLACLTDAVEAISSWRES